MLMRKDAGAAEEAGDDYVAAGRRGGAGSEEVRGNDTQQVTQLKDVPTAPAEDFRRRPGRRQGVALASYRFDKSGLTAAIGPQDADLLPAINLQREIVQRSHRLLGTVRRPAKDRNVAKVEEWWHPQAGGSLTRTDVVACSPVRVGLRLGCKK